MKTILLLTTTAFVLAACATPVPLCDREAQEWNKFETVEDICAVPKVKVSVHVPGDDDGVVNPEDPENPVDPEDPVDPEGRVKSDNSDANGKGGNSHDREDKNKFAQEIAENKKY